MIPRPEDHGYVLLDRRNAASMTPLLDDRLAVLADQGWRKRLDLDGLEVWLGPRARLDAVQVHRRHMLIGCWNGEAALSALVGQSRSASGLAQSVVTGGWGRYVLAWIDDHGRLSLLRDPSGALDCIWWRSGPLSVACSEPPSALDPLLPDSLAVDWERLKRLVDDISLVSDAVIVNGLTAVAPGALVQPEGDPVTRTIWTPAAVVGRPWNDDPHALAEVVDRTTRDLTSGHGGLLAELAAGRRTYSTDGLRPLPRGLA